MLLTFKRTYKLRSNITWQKIKGKKKRDLFLSSIHYHCLSILMTYLHLSTVLITFKHLVRYLYLIATAS